MYKNNFVQIINKDRKSANEKQMLQLLVYATVTVIFFNKY